MYSTNLIFSPSRQDGGGFCTRVSCEVDSGIYVCNDNDHDIFVPYKTMAMYAQYMIDYNDTGGQTACVVSLLAPLSNCSSFFPGKNLGSFANSLL